MNTEWQCIRSRLFVIWKIMKAIEGCRDDVKWVVLVGEERQEVGV